MLLHELILNNYRQTQQHLIDSEIKLRVFLFRYRNAICDKYHVIPNTDYVIDALTSRCSSTQIYHDLPNKIASDLAPFLSEVCCDLPGSALQWNVGGGALLLLMSIGHKVVLVPIGHGQAIRHTQAAVAVLQHLRIVIGGRTTVSGQQRRRRIRRLRILCVRRDQIQANAGRHVIAIVGGDVVVQRLYKIICRIRRGQRMRMGAVVA